MVVRAPGTRAPAQAHAGVFCLDDHAGPSGLELVLEVVRIALGESFLDLRAPRVELDHAGELRQAEDPFAGEVPDVGDSDEGQHVVFAQRLQGMAWTSTSSS